MDKEILFKNRREFRDWLTDNHAGKGVWLVFSKTENLESISAAEALEEALCFGWIDGQIQSIDDIKYVKKFTPRRKGSKWSKRNREIAESLIESGNMTERGLAVIQQAKDAGNWDTPEREPISDEQVGLLIKALTEVEPAFTNFMNMSPSVRKTYTAFFLDAKKEETRKRRLDTIIARLNENKKPM
ncbi:MAG: YdeI/OmpD-associated family protein [Dehalococcoidales bacterium]|nr:YdeI/OmpD-associated family protein [Dehalococcoidales bacterium]